MNKKIFLACDTTNILKVKNGNAGYINIGLRLFTSKGLLLKNNDKSNL